MGAAVGREQLEFDSSLINNFKFVKLTETTACSTLSPRPTSTLKVSRPKPSQSASGTLSKLDRKFLPNRDKRLQQNKASPVHSGLLKVRPANRKQGLKTLVKRNKSPQAIEIAKTKNTKTAQPLKESGPSLALPTRRRRGDSEFVTSEKTEELSVESCLSTNDSEKPSREDGWLMHELTRLNAFKLLRGHFSSKVAHYRAQEDFEDRLAQHITLAFQTSIAPNCDFMSSPLVLAENTEEEFAFDMLELE